MEELAEPTTSSDSAETGQIYSGSSDKDQAPVPLPVAVNNMNILVIEEPIPFCLSW